MCEYKVFIQKALVKNDTQVKTAIMFMSDGRSNSLIMSYSSIVTFDRSCFILFSCFCEFLLTF